METLLALSRAPYPTWDEIVERHSDRVYRLAYRLTGNRHDAEDLTQEVFVRVFRSLSTYTPGTFEGWLHRITTNLFLDQARRKQRIRFDALTDERGGPADQRARRARTSAYADQRFDDDVERALSDAAARLPRRRRALRRRGADLRGDRRDPRRQARHRALADPPRARPAAHARWPTAPPPPGRARYAGPAGRAASPVRGRAHDRTPRRPRQRAPRRPAPPAEEERAWAHVHACHQCRDLVEREGWIKTRLAGLSFDTACAPSSLKGSAARRRCRPGCLPATSTSPPSRTRGRAGSPWSPSAAAPRERP